MYSTENFRITRPEPHPLGNAMQHAGHHWVEHIDLDGRSRGAIALQWCPGVNRWTHSGEVATGTYVNTEGWRYIGECPYPPLEAMGY